jgi:tetratricopeptide (TPR) repeat protein
MKRCLLSLTFLLLSSPLAWGDFAGPEFAPLGRLRASLDARIEKNPKDARAHYELGRLHYQAFVNRALIVGTWGFGNVPNRLRSESGYLYRARQAHSVSLALKAMGVKSAREVPKERRRDFWNLVSKHSKDLEKSKWEPPRLEPADLQKHAQTALKSLTRAIELAPKNALFVLGRASLIRQYSGFVKSKTLKAAAGAFKTLGTRTHAQADFLRAFELSQAKDKELEYQPLTGLEGIVSHEAGEAFLAMVKELGAKVSAELEAQAATVRKHVEALKKLRRGKITPIVLSLRPAARLTELLAAKTKVRFDLDGDGASELWSWVKPTTGFLVWDPRGLGVVRSGRTLFGAYTFRMLSAHGYASLARLDFDLDDWLTGVELEGLSVWFDRNQNGVSDPGEVKTLEKLGIVGLATAPTGREGSSWRSEGGLRLRSGARLTTWDWVTHAE